MNPFERFGINHLSPSSLNLYCANPSLWVGRYLLKWTDEFGPAASRGTAIEAGLDVFLFERKEPQALERALAKFADLTQGQADEEHEAERENIAGMLKQAILALKDFPVPVARQVKVLVDFPGVEVPVLGFVDYAFPEFDLDLKTTKACPSSIKADHGRQMAVYMSARKKPLRVLYCTAKKSAMYGVTDNEAAIHLADAERHARAIRHLLDRASNAADAAKFFAFDRSDFRWSENTLALATAL